MSSEADDVPTRSAAGLAALDVFYAEFNEINFYVEDSEQENLYEVLLRGLFPKIRIDRIFPLGGKEAVLQHATSGSDDTLPAFRAYLLDKDFDDFLGGMVAHPNVFYLDRFCIENYLVDESAFVEIAVESQPRKRRKDLASMLDMRDRIRSTLDALRPLFVYFACVQRFSLDLQNVGSAPEMYCDPKRLWEPDPAVVVRYRSAVISEAKRIGVSPPLEDPIEDDRMEDARTADDHALVSGKHLVAMMFHYLKSKCSLGSITFDSFLYRLAKNCELSSLDGVAARVAAGAVEFKSELSKRR